MQIVSVINYKGGVGKTTVTANLASEIAFRGYKVLALDLDPQASLTFSFVGVDDWHRLYEESYTIKNWYDAFLDENTDLDLESLIISPQRVNQVVSRNDGKLDLICSHLGLINVDLELATKLAGASPRQARNNFLRVYSRLTQGLRTLEDDSYDFVIIDCPPNFNIVTKNAIVASDFVLVPAKPDYLSTLGIDQLQKHVDELIGDYNHYAEDAADHQWSSISPRIIGIVFTMVMLRNGQPISAQTQYISAIERLGMPLFETVIRENKTVYADAPEYGVPVVLQSVSGETYKGVQKELESLADEFLGAIA